MSHIKINQIEYVKCDNTQARLNRKQDGDRTFITVLSCDLGCLLLILQCLGWSCSTTSDTDILWMCTPRGMRQWLMQLYPLQPCSRLGLTLAFGIEPADDRSHFLSLHRKLRTRNRTLLKLNELKSQANQKCKEIENRKVTHSFLSFAVMAGPEQALWYSVESLLGMTPSHTTVSKFKSQLFYFWPASC